MRFVFCVLFFGMGTLSSFAQATDEQPQIAVHSLSTLTVVDGNPVVYYEIWYTNRSSDTVIIDKVEVLDNKDLTVLDTYDENELRERSRLYGDKQTRNDSIIAPGNVAVIYVELELEPSLVKRTLRHKIQLHSLVSGSLFELAGAVTPLKGITPLVIGAPLKDGPWAAIYLPSWERGHRRVIYEPAGTATIPGRYAIDFVKLNEQGRNASPSEDSIVNWAGYGMDVIAVSDGVVESALDTFSESSTLAAYQPYPSEKATGNYISIKLSNGQYAFYEHLKPNSIKVKPGQRVRKGQVIGSVGFTGNTTGPHLHFHIANRNEPLGGEGVPFLFEKFNVLGGYNDFGNFGKTLWDATSQENAARTRERPAANTVVQF